MPESINFLAHVESCRRRRDGLHHARGGHRGAVRHRHASEFRRRGVQTALIRRRLWDAAQSGCEYAVVSTIPGSGSQRNMERRGFRWLTRSWYGAELAENRPPEIEIDIDDLRHYCLQLPHATEKVQCGANVCFKVDGKMFAVAALEVAPVRLSFKCSQENFAELCERSNVTRRHTWHARSGWGCKRSSDSRENCATCLPNRTGWCGSGYRRNVGRVGESRPRTRRKLRLQRRRSEWLRLRSRKRPRKDAASESRAGVSLVAAYACFGERPLCVPRPDERGRQRLPSQRLPHRQSWNARCLQSFARATLCGFWATYRRRRKSWARRRAHAIARRSKSDSRITPACTASYLIRRACRTAQQG